MNSLNGGALRELSSAPDSKIQQFKILSNFFSAVQKTFPSAWLDHTPRTSRLLHGVGIMSMGYVMEHLYSISNSTNEQKFQTGLEKLIKHCTWTEGHWEFGYENKRPWNGLQFVPRDYLELSQHLIRLLKS